MSLTDQAILKVRQLIIEGRLRPGDRLAPEPELAAQLGLSRSSLREAVRALNLIGVFNTRQGDGTYVTSLEPEVLLEFISVVLDLVQDDRIHEIFEVRRVLEPQAIALAARRVTDADIAGLEDCLARLDEATDPEQRIAIDAEFHDRIMQATGNSTLRSLVGSVSHHTLRARLWRSMTSDSDLQWTSRQHRAILAALADHDATAAQAAAYVHALDTERSVRRYLNPL